MFMKSRLEWVVALCIACLGLSASAQPSGHHVPDARMSVVTFDETTWPQLLKTGPRPAAYLFTTSYCSTCPAAFAVIHQAALRSHKHPDLAAVMMDVEGDKALRHASHFSGMTTLYAFEGYEPAIRRVVDPQWQNITPYVVLVDSQGRPQKTIGPPTNDMLRRWLRDK